MQLKAIFAALVMMVSPVIAQVPPTDEQVEQAAIQNAMQACGAAATYNIQTLLIYCQIAKYSSAIEPKLTSSIKAKSGTNSTETSSKK